MLGKRWDHSLEDEFLSVYWGQYDSIDIADETLYNTYKSVGAVLESPCFNFSKVYVSER